MPTRVRIRRGTSSEWDSYNPILAAAEPALVTDAGVMKIGDGSSNWNDLPTNVRTDKYIYPESSGAVGDGSANDASALQKAIVKMYSSGRPLYLGQKYKCNDKLVFDQNLPVNIIGRQGSKIEFTQAGADDCINIDAITYGRIFNIELINNTVGYTGKLVSFEKSGGLYPRVDIEWSKVLFRNPGGIGVSMDEVVQPNQRMFNECLFDSCDYGLYALVAANTSNITAEATVFKNPGQWLIYNIHGFTANSCRFIGRPNDPGYAFYYGLINRYGARAYFNDSQFQRDILSAVTATQAAWVHSVSGGLNFNRTRIDTVTHGSVSPMGAMVRVGNATTRMEMPVIFSECIIDGPRLLEVTGTQQLVELVLDNNVSVYDDIISDPSNLILRISRRGHKTGSVAITAGSAVTQVPSLYLQPRRAEPELWERQPLGNIFMADRVNWDPLARGSGNPYIVVWDGAAWQPLSAFL